MLCAGLGTCSTPPRSPFYGQETPLRFPHGRKLFLSVVPRRSSILVSRRDPPDNFNEESRVLDVEAHRDRQAAQCAETEAATAEHSCLCSSSVNRTGAAPSPSALGVLWSLIGRSLIQPPRKATPVYSSGVRWRSAATFDPVLAVCVGRWGLGGGIRRLRERERPRLGAV